MADVSLDRIVHSWTKQTKKLIGGKPYSIERLEEIINCPSLYSEASKGVIQKGDKVIEFNARGAQYALAKDLDYCMNSLGGGHGELPPEQRSKLVNETFILSSKLTEKIIATGGIMKNNHIIDVHSGLRQKYNNYHFGGPGASDPEIDEDEKIPFIDILTS